MSVTIGRAKWEFTVMVAGTPVVYASDGQFLPYKIILTSHPSKASVTVVGRKLSGSQQGRSVTFDINGYPQHRKPPDWVMEVLKEAAFPREAGFDAGTR